MKIYKNSEAIKNFIYLFSFRNKQDILANDFVKWIFDLVKNKSFGEHNRDNVFVKINSSKTKINPATFSNFHIVSKTEDADIHLSIFIYDEFFSGDYQNFNYVLYEVIRHELEHIDKFILDRKPDENYVKLYNQLLSTTILSESDLESHAELISQYILSDTEIDSYVKSIMYVAKKQNVSAIDVIEQVIKRTFFNNNSELMKKGFENNNIRLIIEKTRKELRSRLSKFHPKFKEIWL